MKTTAADPYDALSNGRSLSEVLAVAALVAQTLPLEEDYPPESFAPTALHPQTTVRPTVHAPEESLRLAA